MDRTYWCQFPFKLINAEKRKIIPGHICAEQHFPITRHGEILRACPQAVSYTHLTLPTKA